MSVILIHYCDWPGCGKEFKKYGAPWGPDYCPEHMDEYHKSQSSFHTYTWPKSVHIQAWYEPAEVNTPQLIIGGSRHCSNCHGYHPAGPCENWRPNYGDIGKIFDSNKII